MKDVHKLQFVRCYPSELSDEAWEDVIPAFQAQSMESHPDDPIQPPQYVRRNLELIEKHPVFDPEIFLIYGAGQDLVGWMLIGFARPDADDYEERKHACFTEIYVLPAFRRHGIGTEALRRLVMRAREREVTVLQGGTEIADGHAFARYFGADTALESRQSRAYMQEIDWEMVEAWRRSGQERNPETRIHCFDGLYSEDEEDLVEYGRVFTAALREMPHGELEGLATEVTPERLRGIHEQNTRMGTTSISVVTVEANGRLSGLTRVNYHPERGHLAMQGITGVPVDERGRGLGKWLKAEMLVYIKERYPDVQFIDTGNAETNAAMRSINERVGFRPYTHNIAFKLKVEDAVKRLGIT